MLAAVLAVAMLAQSYGASDGRFGLVCHTHTTTTEAGKQTSDDDIQRIDVDLTAMVACRFGKCLKIREATPTEITFIDQAADPTNEFSTEHRFYVDRTNGKLEEHLFSPGIKTSIQIDGTCERALWSPPPKTLF